MCRIITIFWGIILIGCCPTKIASERQSDSLRVEVKERVVYEIDTVEVEIPLISESRETRDTMSRLQNQYAMTEAVVSGGVLYHSLQTRPQLQKIEFKKPIIKRDSVVVRNFYRDVKVEVERELTFLQKFQINGFWGMLAVFVLSFFFRWIRVGR